MRMARKAFPGQKSYGLNNICRWMGLVNAHAHRALSDARVATEILTRALPLVPLAETQKMLARNSGVVFLPPNMPERVFQQLPEATGVYYMMNEKGKPIYIGKAINIKKRIRQHFTANTESSRTQVFMRDVVDIAFELTGNELIALLLEDAEIRKHWPEQNSAQKRKVTRTFIISYHDHSGYRRLAFQSSNKAVGAIKTFPSMQAAREWLHRMAAEYGLDQRLLGLSMFEASREQPTPEVHNDIVDRAISDFLMRDPSYILASSGRAEGETGYVWVEGGVLKGFAFLQDEIRHPDELLFHLKPLQHSENTTSILEAFEKLRWGYRRIALDPI